MLGLVLIKDEFSQSVSLLCQFGVLVMQHVPQERVNMGCVIVSCYFGVQDDCNLCV